MDEDLSRHRKKLQFAISEAIAESTRIKGEIETIRESGYNVVLLCEATVGFTRRTGGQETSDPQAEARSSEFSLTEDDRDFLRGMQILPD